MVDDVLVEGWAKVYPATRYHYFGRDGRSLCGTYLLSVLVAPSRAVVFHADTGADVLGRDCKACTRRLRALR